MAGEAVPFIGVASCVRTFFAAAGAEEDEVEVNVELDDEEGKDDEEEEHAAEDADCSEVSVCAVPVRGVASTPGLTGAEVALPFPAAAGLLLIETLSLCGGFSGGSHVVKKAFR